MFYGAVKYNAIEKVYGVNATIIIFVFVLYFIVLYCIGIEYNKIKFKKLY